MPSNPKTTDLATLERIARSNGYWHHIEPFAGEIERLRALVIHYADQAGVPADELKRMHNV